MNAKIAHIKEVVKRTYDQVITTMTPVVLNANKGYLIKRKLKAIPAEDSTGTMFLLLKADQRNVYRVSKDGSIDPESLIIHAVKSGHTSAQKNLLRRVRSVSEALPYIRFIHQNFDKPGFKNARDLLQIASQLYKPRELEGIIIRAVRNRDLDTLRALFNPRVVNLKTESLDNVVQVFYNENELQSLKTLFEALPSAFISLIRMGISVEKLDAIMSLNPNTDYFQLSQNGEKAIACAVKNDHPDLAIALIERNPNPVQQDEIFSALKARNCLVIDYILTKKSNYRLWGEFRNDENRNILHYSILTRNPEVLKTLLKHLDPCSNLFSSPDARGHSPIDYVLQIGNKEMLLMILAHISKEVIYSQNTQGQNILHRYAAQVLDSEGLQLILDKTINDKVVWKTDQDGNNALMIIAISGNVKNAGKLLLRVTSKEDLLAKNKAGQTAYDIAQKYGNNDVASMIKATLYDMGQGEHIFIEEKPEFDSHLINQVNREGMSRLMLAAQAGNIAEIRRLISWGADTEQFNDRSNIMYYAIESDKPKAVRELLKCGANMSGALLVASIFGRYEIIKLLLDYGADIEVRGNENKTSLLFAIEFGHTECAKLLINSRANLEAKDDEGRTPLIRAAMHDNIEIVQILVEKKVDIKALNNTGADALHCANVNHSIKCGRYLYELQKRDLGSKPRDYLILDQINNYRGPINVQAEQFLSIISEIKVATRSAALGNWAYPGHFLYQVIRDAKLLSTNIQYYDQKFYGVMRTFFKGLQAALPAHFRVFQNATPEFMRYGIGTYCRNSTAIDLATKSVSTKIGQSALSESEQQYAGLLLQEVRNLRYEGTSLKWGETGYSLLIKDLAVKVARANPSEITAEEARYSFPLSYLEIAGELMLHAASEPGIPILHDRKNQNAFMFAAKKNRPDLMLALAIGRIMRSGGNDFAPQKDIDEALFWGIFHGNYTTVKTCLELGANVNSVPVLEKISCAELAIHLGYKQIVEVIAIASNRTYEEFSEQDIPNIKERYAKLAIEKSVACYPNNPDLQFGYVALLSERFISAKYVKYQLRKILKAHDDIELSSIDGTHDLFHQNSEIPELPDYILAQIKAKGINVALPKFREDLVSIQDIQQIYQELIVANMLGQAPSLSLEGNRGNGMGRDVALPEAFKNTLAGEVLIFTDKVMKEFDRNSIYFSPDKVLSIGDNWPITFGGKIGSNQELYLTGQGLPESTIQSGYLQAVHNNHLNAGGLPIPLMKRLNTERKLIESKFMQQQGYTRVGDSSARWKNCDFKMSYSGNTIFCSQGYKLFEDNSYFKVNGEKAIYSDDCDLPTAKFTTENIARIPEFARFFELLKVLYSLQPIAQLAVSHKVIPDFATMPIPKFVRTPDRFAARFNFDLDSGPELADSTLEEAINNLNVGEWNNVSLGNGTAYTTSEYTKGVQRDDNLLNSSVVVCPLLARFHNEEWNWPSKEEQRYVPDTDWKAVFKKAGEKFFALTGSKDFVTDQAGLDEFRGEFPQATAEQYHEYFQIQQNRTEKRPDIRHEIIEYVLKVDAWLPEGRSKNNVKYGSGGGKQNYTVNKYEDILEKVDGNPIRMK